MTVLRIYRKGGLYIGFSCSGHSGYAEEGHDIVCASVSTAVQYCVNCGEQIDRVPMELSTDPKTALIRCVATEPDPGFSKHIEILASLGETLAEAYANYFKLEIMEV